MNNDQAVDSLTRKAITEAERIGFEFTEEDESQCFDRVRRVIRQDWK